MIVEDIVARILFLSLPEGLHNFVQSVGCFWFVSDCTVNPVKAYPSYSRSLEVNWFADGCFWWYFYIDITGVTIPLIFRSIRGQKGATDGFLLLVRSGNFP